ncbi:MAG TPA: hypothetical protein VFS30_13570 [Dehalococcoidia bacterium]|nr:hypothetical protein [Dehalococcoidia bacterium]
MAEGQRSLPSTLPFLRLQDKSAAQIAAWFGLPLAALMGLVASLVVVLAPDTNRPIFDDSYISLTYARNLAEIGKLSFDGETWSTGATSPLHVAIMAAPIALGVDPFSVSLGVGVLSHALLAAGVYLLGWAIFRSRLASILGAFAISTAGLAVLDSGNGLETSLFMALLAFSMASYLLDASPRGRLLTGVLIALLIWTRPEGAVMLPAVLLYRWLERGEGETLREYAADAARLAGPGVFAGGTIALFSLIVNGTLTGTGSAKWRFFQEDEQPLTDKVSVATAQIGLLAGTVVPLILLAALAARRRETVLFALFWAPVLIAYVLLFPGGLAHYFYRYQHPVLPLLAVLAGGGGAFLITLALSQRDYVVKGLVALALIVALVPIGSEYRHWRDVYGQASRETRDDLEAMALDLNTIVKPDETLAAHDIGALGYFADFRVLDMVGLVNDDVIPYHEGRDFATYFNQVEPDYLLTFPDWDLFFFRLFPQDHPERFELVKVYEGGPVRNQPYVLYRVIHGP